MPQPGSAKGRTDISVHLLTQWPDRYYRHHTIPAQQCTGIITEPTLQQGEMKLYVPPQSTNQWITDTDKWWHAPCVSLSVHSHQCHTICPVAISHAASDGRHLHSLDAGLSTFSRSLGSLRPKRCKMITAFLYLHREYWLSKTIQKAKRSVDSTEADH